MDVADTIPNAFLAPVNAETKNEAKRLDDIGDPLEELWLTYYASNCNSARAKVSMMKSEMPVRHWPTLPETKLIPGLLQDASQRAQKMVDVTEGFAETAAHFMPESRSLASLRSPQPVALLVICTAKRRRQYSVEDRQFSRGPATAKVVIVGEQPGDREDLGGAPSVGPAGELLNDAIAEAGIQRSDVYITNVVKHFKFTKRGKRRLHKKPNSREVFACRPWLEAERELLRPHVIVCLGSTAAQSLFGRYFSVTKQRGCGWRRNGASERLRRGIRPRY